MEEGEARASACGGEAMSWSRTPPPGPGFYFVRVEYPDKSVTVLAKVTESNALFHDLERMDSYWKVDDAVLWWSPRIEPPPWPAMEEKKQ